MMRALLTGCVMVFVLLAGLAEPDSVEAANQIANADFSNAAGLGGWSTWSVANGFTPCSGTADCGPFRYIDADECCGTAASGSVEATSQIGTALPAVLAQCVSVAADSIDYGAWIRVTNLPAGVAADKLPRVDVIWWTDADCVGTPSVAMPRPPGVASPTWQSIGMGNIVAPPGFAQTALLMLIIPNADDASTAVTARFDQVIFGPTGTVPVELQAFTVD
jgi:hypothetical protein